MSQHHGLLNTSDAMRRLHRVHNTRGAIHIERAICGFCWLDRHPGGRIANGLGVVNCSAQEEDEGEEATA